MVRIAVLSEQVAAQLRTYATTAPRELENVEVVWSGVSLAELRKRGRELRPQVLILDLDLLGGDPRRVVESLADDVGADLALLLYTFARRDTIHSVTSSRLRLIKVPVSMASLRLNMLSLLVKDVFRAKSPATGTLAASVSAAELPSASSGSLDPRERSSERSPPTGAAPRLFTPTQLGRLQEIRSSVRCECTNHLAELVTSLAAFEEYARTCANKDAEDEAIHNRLFQETGRARQIMEEALTMLCRYENIEV